MATIDDKPSYAFVVICFLVVLTALAWRLSQIVDRLERVEQTVGIQEPADD